MKQSFVSPILRRLAKKAGVKVNIEPRYRYAGQIVLPNGTKRYFLNTNFDLNPLGASEIARDKDYASYFLRSMGYPVSRSGSFFSRRWCKIVDSRRNRAMAYRFAQRLGFPVIVKPNSKSQGCGVTKVFTKREFDEAVRFICERENVFLVQRVAQGNDYRLVVLDGKVISAYERIPLIVTGDGRSTVRELLKQKQRQFRRAGRDTNIKINDFRIIMGLRRRGMSLRTVPARGERVQLLDNANLSSGGDARDVTSVVHPQWCALAVRITRDMGLRFCGVDLMIEGSIKDPPGQYIVLEINAAPGLDHYASGGRKQRRIVERLYLEVLRAM
ncbi:cyanophycin synthetase [Candidatus Jorgensenbacteria bacterium CG10_big_fil_rev_8_21_14_0_10_54_38]|uniref:Cyanophycin synthetase n=2 Tax=Candidatus Joergenseniibacteriota TaxID=1752739 RepID=A0A2M6WFJ9_9BACT|nr:MAG: cyanophycin synthetase [Candidatus Jorgensenbacteria bacterium CG23_combo_of_CG06-09_8_20_14_all_54_14]PIT91567.1 MAG: cyanophycin synthetase [Candidatus Jorgensenbacteria bacterium CG10_big_fil_rev_8_21_14_0_10_54_38]